MAAAISSLENLLQTFFAQLFGITSKRGQEHFIESTMSNEKVANKLDKAADKIIAASETTNKAMSNISRGITAR